MTLLSLSTGGCVLLLVTLCWCSACRFKVDPSVCLSEVVESCPPQLTGADLYALCSDAMMCAIKRKISRITEGMWKNIPVKDE